jgi:hypothetical protein
VAQFIGGLDPDVELPFIAAEEDTGPIVRAIVLDSAPKRVIGYRARITLRGLIETFSQVTGVKAEPVVLPKEESVVPFPPELQQELDDNWGYWKEFGYYGGDPTIINPDDVSVMRCCERLFTLTCVVGTCTKAQQRGGLLQKAGLVQSLWLIRAGIIDSSLLC